MIMNYHKHTPQTNPRHREEEPHNTDCHKISGRQLNLSNQLCLPIKMIAKLDGHKVVNNKKKGPNTEPPQTMGATINNKTKLYSGHMYLVHILNVLTINNAKFEHK